MYEEANFHSCSIAATVLQFALSLFLFVPLQKMSKSLKKIVEESRDKNVAEVDMCDRGVSNMLDIPGLCEYLLIRSLIRFFTQNTIRRYYSYFKLS